MLARVLMLVLVAAGPYPPDASNVQQTEIRVARRQSGKRARPPSGRRRTTKKLDDSDMFDPPPPPHGDGKPDDDLELAKMEKRRPWVVTNLGASIRPRAFKSVEVAPSNPNIFYVAADEGGILLTTDGGTTWHETQLTPVVLRLPQPKQRVRWLKGVGSWVPRAISLTANFGHIIHTPWIYEGPPDSDLLPTSVMGPAVMDEPWSPDGPPWWFRYGYCTRAICMPTPVDDIYMPISTPGGAFPWERARPSGHWPEGEIREIAAHPNNPKLVLAATSFGVWRSKDGGASWLPVYFGGVPEERDAFFLMFHPRDPELMCLRAGGGLHISHDGGTSFFPVADIASQIRWVEIVPSNSKIIYAAADDGLYRSEDGGSHFHPIRTGATRYILVDPFDPGRLLIATESDFYRTKNGGRTWRRVETGGFDTRQLRFAKVDPNDGDHLVAAGSTTIWESFDFGGKWTAVTTAEETEAMDWAGPGFRDLLVLTSKQLLRLSRSRAREPSRAGLEAYQRRIQAEPTLWETLNGTLESLGLKVEDQTALRHRAAVARWLPWAGAGIGYLHSFGEVSYPLGVPMPLKRGGTPGVLYTALTLRWDLDSAMFDSGELGGGRIHREIESTRTRMTNEVPLMYDERRAHLWALLVQPPADLSTRTHLLLKVEELTARLNALTGGLWQEPLEWLEQQR